ncbi:MAG: glycoside hydrolase family 31 protein, partial [Candidatus Pacebacteria bacterium]|nr:glycoside hydrolase family 31 protein [Candidatus Paceibacterota bacterium]
MLEDDTVAIAKAEKKEAEKPAETCTEQEEPTSDLVKANKKRVKSGFSLGGVVFLVLVFIIVYLVATSSLPPHPHKPVNKRTRFVTNPYRVVVAHYDTPQKMLVTIFNNRTLLERNDTNSSATTENEMLGTEVRVKNDTRNFEPLMLQAHFTQLDEHLINIKYLDPEWPRWEVPEFNRQADPYESVSKQIKLPLGAELIEKDEGSLFAWHLFDKYRAKEAFMTTEHCRLQYYDKYIEFEARIQTNQIYGMGERMDSFILRNDNYSLWNRDINYEYGKDSETGTYSSHPFFLSRLKNHKEFIGVFMHNSNAMLFSFWNTLGNNTFINYKMIGGIIDLYVFYAADADYILKKYHSLIGRPYLPPVWGLGFHQGRSDYTLEKMKEVVAQHKKHGIPIDSIWGDLQISDNHKTFTVDSKKFAGLKEFVKDLLHSGSTNMHFVAVTAPYLKKEVGYKYYDEAVKEYCLVASAEHNELPFEGRTIAGTSVWPDFFLHEALLVWAGGLHDLKELTEFDGIWIVDTE